MNYLPARGLMQLHRLKASKTGSGNGNDQIYNATKDQAAVLGFLTACIPSNCIENA